MAMAVTSMPADFNLSATTTVDAATGKSGLYNEDDYWNYYVDDNIATSTTTLVKYNGSWWYVKDG